MATSGLNTRYFPRLDRAFGQPYVPQAPPRARAAGMLHAWPAAQGAHTKVSNLGIATTIAGITGALMGRLSSRAQFARSTPAPGAPAGPSMPTPGLPPQASLPPGITLAAPGGNVNMAGLAPQQIAPHGNMLPQPTFGQPGGPMPATPIPGGIRPLPKRR